MFNARRNINANETKKTEEQGPFEILSLPAKKRTYDTRDTKVLKGLPSKCEKLEGNKNCHGSRLENLLEIV